RHARRDSGAHGDAPHGQVPPPDEADGAVEGDETVLEQDRHGALHHGHAVTASDSIGSLSDAPGGIIGNTLASCSMRNSTSAGPPCARAARGTPPPCSAPSPAPAG